MKDNRKKGKKLRYMHMPEWLYYTRLETLWGLLGEDPEDILLTISTGMG